MAILPHNQRTIDGLSAQDGKRTTYRSEVVIGLVLEVMPSGMRSWRVRYRTKGGRLGKTRVFTIGDATVIKLGPAVDKARAILSAVQVDGSDPQAKAQFASCTFEELFGDWLERHAKLKKKSWLHDEGMYRRHIHQRLGRLQAAEIKRGMIAAALDDIAKKATGIQANRAQALLSSVFNWAVNEGRLEFVPTYRIPKRGVETPRERVLSAAEIVTLWSGLGSGSVGVQIELIIRLALVTAQRRGEIAEASKSELDLAGCDPAWVIPGSRTKNGIMHRVPLTPLAVELFHAAVNASDGPLVFPGHGKDGGPISLLAVTRAMFRLTNSLGITNATVHDLRRTVGTNLARLGVSKDVRARLLNHVDGARSVTDAVYNQHEFWAEKRAALQLWESELRRIVNDTSASA